MFVSPILFLAAYAADWLIGDPQWLLHPVRFFGLFIDCAEKVARKLTRGKTSEFIAGAIMTLLTVAIAVASSASLLWWLNRINLLVGDIVLVYLAMTTMATRNLLDEAIAVNRGLKSDDLSLARSRVARIVGRDTNDLSRPEIIRATIETLAESASDGIVAPIFYLAIGGVPAALAYKAINTLDSMIGHNDSRYKYFGKFAARLDDVANFVPARLTAFLILAASFLYGADYRSAGFVWMRDAAAHASPNAGRPEAAMAGALGVRLGGLNYYDGEPHHGAYFGDGKNALDLDALRSSLVIVGIVSFLMFLLASGCLSMLQFRVI